MSHNFKGFHIAQLAVAVPAESELVGKNWTEI
jgi:hypothetical protein